MAAPVYCMSIPVSKAKWTGRVAQSVGHLTRKSEVLGPGPGPGKQTNQCCLLHTSIHEFKKIIGIKLRL